MSSKDLSRLCRAMPLVKMWICKSNNYILDAHHLYKRPFPFLNHWLTHECYLQEFITSSLSALRIYFSDCCKYCWIVVNKYNFLSTNSSNQISFSSLKQKIIWYAVRWCYKERYKLFIKYCVFSEILRYIPDSDLSRFLFGFSECTQ